MDISMGLLAAFCWGATDFLVGLNARLVGVRRSVLFGQMFGFVVMSLILLLAGNQFIRLSSAGMQPLYLGLFAAFCTLIGALALAKAFALGKTALVAPVVTTYGTFTTALAWLTGEVLTLWQFAGMGICVIGVVLVSFKKREVSAVPAVGSTRSLGYALLAAICYGVSFWVQGKYSLPVIGPVNMLWLTYAVGIIFLWREIPRLIRNVSAIRLNTAASLCGASLFNLAGFSAFSLGAVTGSVSIVTVISTLSGGVAALLGLLVFKERLNLPQGCGVMLVMLGVLFIHLYG